MSSPVEPTRRALEPAQLIRHLGQYFPRPGAYRVAFSGGLDSTVLLNALAEHRAALDHRARKIWMTPIGGAAGDVPTSVEETPAPADIYVLYPGEGSERHLSSSFFIRIEGAEWGTAEDGIVILADDVTLDLCGFTLRGEPGLADEPQHELMGQVTGQMPGELAVPADDPVGGHGDDQ